MNYNHFDKTCGKIYIVVAHPFGVLRKQILRKGGIVATSRMSRADWALLTIAAAQNRPVTPVQLQKCLFLLGQEEAASIDTDYYDFVPYDYGPFCLDVYRDTEQLASEDLIQIKYAPHGRWKEYQITSHGLVKANAIREALDSEITTYIDKLVAWAQSLSFRQLVKEVYDRYPSYRENSVFQD